LAEAPRFRFLGFSLFSFISEWGFGGADRRLPSTRWNSGSFVGSDLFAMIDRFASPKLTLRRAQHHIRDFNALVNEFINRKPWTYFVDKESQPGKDIHKVHFTEQLPEMLPCMLADAANNLRSVLDQIGYASAYAAKSPSLKATKFPVGPTKRDFRNNLAGGSKDLPSEIRDIFERSKAYRRGNPTLWTINEIANAKKHFALVPLKIGTMSAVFYTDHVADSPTAGLDWNARKREVTLLSVSSGTKLNIRGHFTFSIAIQGIKAIRRQSAVGFLNAAADEVERILAVSEAECRRIDLIK
jgi:hypothetical protein